MSAGLVPAGMYFLLFPMQGPFSDDIDETSQKETYEHKYSQKTIPTQVSEIDGIGVEEDHFHVKQYKKDRHQEILDGHGLTGVTELLDSAFKYLKLIGSHSFRPKKMAPCDHNGHQTECKKQLNSDGEVVTGLADLRILCYCLRLKEKHPYHRFIFRGAKLIKLGM
jgi:hypothetical protein